VGIVAVPRAPDAISGRRYVNQLLRFEPARRVLDAIAYHPYGATGLAVHRHLGVARRVMRLQGMGRLQIWVTGVGWGSEGP
jgi:hypothetical protein